MHVDCFLKATLLAANVGVQIHPGQFHFGHSYHNAVDGNKSQTGCKNTAGGLISKVNYTPL